MELKETWHRPKVGGECLTLLLTSSRATCVGLIFSHEAASEKLRNGCEVIGKGESCSYCIGGSTLGLGHENYEIDLCLDSSSLGCL